MYVTPPQLAIGPDSLQELSELFGVAPELMRATLDDADRTSWDADQVADADAALASIEQYCSMATGEIDAYLVRRGYVVPMDATQFPVLRVWASSIARYHLHPQRDRTSEETGRIERDYRTAIKSLEALVQGNLSLGAGDPLATNQATAADTDAVRVQSSPRKFSRGSLGEL